MVSERINGLATVLGAVRADSGVTQPMLVERVGLGRSVVAQRVAELESAGLIEGAGLGPSSGGRAPRRLRVRAGRGVVLGVDVGAVELNVGIADLAGKVLASRRESVDVAAGPDVVLSRAEALADELRRDRAAIWAVGVGVPGPVEFRSGLPVVPPIMPGWDRYPIRQRLRTRFGAPVWVDNDVNLMALGELHAGPDPGGHMLYVRVGAGIGAAIVMDGRLYRGANGSAGDIGHVAIPEGGTIICRCGNIGCLEAVAGGAAISGAVRAADAGDRDAREFLHRASTLLGGTLATLISFYNPDRLVLGGSLARAREHVLDAIREVIHKRALPLATRDLRIEVSVLPEQVAGVSGAVHLALDEVFAPANLEIWLAAGSPDQVPQNVW
ncbi:putative NBD/HSP70 family sugar kinase [Actinoplanes lutulentus]|uniref:Putative NBD/HSP70 family sugar kinase n=1 Tax=Actinoplanes lutulentus TaxID=1287878 RepID=A0A327Z7E9_9ACTN|nr:ROK family transcriptional regulator [Actinoplanes lutulentus]MBB2948563.1 putative NBD/HSP70 family sugar kinase [Actinoplanes lutulentus]RAK34405.1 putative NBD/HSP70 family sugar kinase [Actinoplanes lutulentus]